MEARGGNDFLADLAAEDEEASAAFAERDFSPPEDAQLKPDVLIYWRACNALRFDRAYGAMGGEGPIYYQAISRYACDHGIGGTEFLRLEQLIRAMESEYLAFVNERLEAEKRKQEQER